MISYFKKLGLTRAMMVIIGNVFVGFGVAAFKLALFGNDPFDGMNMALAEVIGIAYGNVQVIVNILLFIIEIAFGRKYIGFGTLVNAIGLGYIATFFHWLMIGTVGQPESIVLRLVAMLFGILGIGLGLSLYQTADAGVAPYDALSLIMHDKWQKIPYFWCRMSNDVVCALVCFFAGGIVGLGTLVAAFCIGPFISFFNKVLSTKLVKAK